MANMKLMIVFFLAALAMGGAQDCSEERTVACMDEFLTSILDDRAKEEVCKELSNTVECLKETVEECLGDEVDDDVEEGLKEMEKLLSDCEGSSVDTDIEQCMQDNSDYILECLPDALSEVLDATIEDENDVSEEDEDAVQCLIYAAIVGCLAERSGEKCGPIAKQLAETKLVEDPPAEVAEVCQKALGGEILELLEKKKKK